MASAGKGARSNRLRTWSANGGGGGSGSAALRASAESIVDVSVFFRRKRVMRLHNAVNLK